MERIIMVGVRSPIFFTVPPANSGDFIGTIKDIASRNGIDVIIPVVDEENPRKVVGMLRRLDLQNFYQKRMLARELHG